MPEGLVLPESGTGERAARRREQEASPSSAGGPPSPPPPEKRTMSPVARYGFIAALVVLVLLVPMLTYVGAHAVLQSSQGRELNVETDPSKPGFEAQVDPTPTLLMVQTDAAG